MSVWLFFAAAVMAWLVGWPVGAWLRKAGLIDRPNARSSHAIPTARGGGVVFLLGLGVISLAGVRPLPIEAMVLLMAGGVLASVSFLDDVRSLSPLVRFGVHLLCAGAALWVLGFGRVDVFEEWWGRFGIGVFGLSLVLVVWVVGYTNAFNFMDGINGIASGQACVTALGMVLVTGLESGTWDSPSQVLCVVLAGSVLGFLPHNFPRARMFMGDVGSAPLGFLLASLALWLVRDFGWWLLVPLSLLHANFVLDTSVTLVRRMARGETWHQPHREHFYQRLVRAGKSHAFVTGWEMVLQCLVLGLALLYLKVGLIGKGVIVTSVLGIWTVFFCFAERTFRLSKQE